MARVILAMDAGGTNVRISLSRWENGHLQRLRFGRYRSAGWDTMEKDLTAFLRGLPPQESTGCTAVFALAGVVEKGGTRGSVTRWGPGEFRDLAQLARLFGIMRVSVMNDLEAANLAIALPPGIAIEPIAGRPAPMSRSSFVHLMPGTGLGIGLFLGGRSLPSEGGGAPCVFGGVDACEIAVEKGFRRETGEALPTYETILCAEGLVSMARMLLGTHPKPEEITREARPGLYDREVRVYATFLARGAQGAVLMLLPEACYLSGPIASALPKESWKTFAKEFVRHPVHGELLGQVQLGLVREPELALKGAELEGVRLAEAGGGAA